MFRLGYLFLLGIFIAVGAAPLARAQDDLERYKTEAPDPKQEKAKEKKQKQPKVKDNSETRKHWYSLPHFRHKKQESESDPRRRSANSSTRTTALRPVNTTTRTKPANKAAMAKGQRNKTAASKSSQTAQAKTTHAAKAGTTASRKTAATTSAQGRNAKAETSSSKQTVASANHGKAVRHDCSEAEAKKSGCGKASN
jgi:hypothetical protein